MIRPKDTVTIAWCDNGMVDGKFAEGIAYTLLTGPQHGVVINNAMRVQGNQIGRQTGVIHVSVCLNHSCGQWIL